MGSYPLWDSWVIKSAQMDLVYLVLFLLAVCGLAWYTAMKRIAGDSGEVLVYRGALVTVFSLFLAFGIMAVSHAAG